MGVQDELDLRRDRGRGALRGLADGDAPGPPGIPVLLVDRASFPSDTLSCHFLHQPGVASLERWGLLPAVVRSGCPPVRRQLLDAGPFMLRGAPAPDGDVTEAYAVRRIVLDKILVDAAAEAGAAVRERGRGRHHSGAPRSSSVNAGEWWPIRRWSASTRPFNAGSESDPGRFEAAVAARIPHQFVPVAEQQAPQVERRMLGSSHPPSAPSVAHGARSDIREKPRRPSAATTDDRGSAQPPAATLRAKHEDPQRDGQRQR